MVILRNFQKTSGYGWERFMSVLIVCDLNQITSYEQSVVDDSKRTDT
jgi:hypothetical protein